MEIKPHAVKSYLSILLLVLFTAVVLFVGIQKGCQPDPRYAKPDTVVSVEYDTVIKTVQVESIKYRRSFDTIYITQVQSGDSLFPCVDSGTLAHDTTIIRSASEDSVYAIADTVDITLRVHFFADPARSSYVEIDIKQRPLTVELYNRKEFVTVTEYIDSTPDTWEKILYVAAGFGAGALVGVISR